MNRMNIVQQDSKSASSPNQPSNNPVLGNQVSPNQPSDFNGPLTFFNAQKRQHETTLLTFVNGALNAFEHSGLQLSAEGYSNLTYLQQKLGSSLSNS